MKISVDKAKKYFLFLIKCIVVYFVSDGLSTLLRVISSIIEGQHGAPSFVTPEFAVYGFVLKVLVIVSFLLLGNTIPVKGKILKGIIFSLLYWISAYLPQVLGMLGGHSKTISQEAFSFGTILADSLGYLVNGAAIGFIFAKKEAIQLKTCTKKNYVLSCVVSMLSFPIILIAFELIGGSIWNQLFCINAFEIVSSDYKSFYIVFYLFQAISGILFPIFYHLTEFNQKQNWIKFASVYAWMLWLPIVIIMVFFGVGFLETIIWGIMMVIAIYIDVAIFTRIMNTLKTSEQIEHRE